MKKLFFVAIAVFGGFVLNAQTKAGVPLRTADAAVVRPVAGGVIPVGGAAPAGGVVPGGGVVPIKSGGGAAAAGGVDKTVGTVPLRSTDQAGSGKTGVQPAAVKPVGGGQALPSDSAARKIEKGN